MYCIFGHASRAFVNLPKTSAYLCSLFYGHPPWEVKGDWVTTCLTIFLSFVVLHHRHTAWMSDTTVSAFSFGHWYQSQCVPKLLFILIHSWSTPNVNGSIASKTLFCYHPSLYLSRPSSKKCLPSQNHRSSFTSGPSFQYTEHVFPALMVHLE